MNRRSIILAVYFLTLTGTALWLGIIFLAPFLKSLDSGLSVFLYAIFSPICHQVPSRSFYFFGFPLAVCGRCLGIYFGFIVGVLFYPFLRGLPNTKLPRIKTFVFFSLPIIIDTVGNFLGLWATPNLPRLIIGFLWGLTLPFYFLPGITDFFLSLIHKEEKFG